MIRLPWPGRRQASRGGGHEGQASAASPDGAPPQGVVPGERGRTVASRARSLQSRLNGLLAAALAIGVGIAMLAWYYAEAMHRPERIALTPQPTDPGAGRMSLPALGPIAPPRLAAVPGQPSACTCASSLAALAKSVPAAHLLPAAAEPAWPRSPQAYDGPPKAGSLRRTALARRLSGAVFARSGSGSVDAAAVGSQTPGAGSAPYPGYPAAVARGSASPGTLSALLRPSVLPATRAELLPQQRLLLAKGTFIHCTLETAIDSTLPGMTTCVTATDTFSADGTVVLLERGTKLIGETRGQVRQGMARMFVIWTEARTPSGVVVRLDSPGTDALGRSGLTGRVNRHFWQRFGAALLVSTIDGAVQSRLQSGTGTVVVDPAASEDVMTEALRGSVDIPPTVTVPNGARIQVLVARDVDFRSVYELVPRS